jgi:hypothetical protein
VAADTPKLAPKVQLAARAAGITNFQMLMADVLLSMIFCGLLERHPGFKVVIGEAGIGWIPYVLNRMDAEWEDLFKELDLKMPPSEYWRRQCNSTYQTDPVGSDLVVVDEIDVSRVLTLDPGCLPLAGTPASNFRNYVANTLGSRI